MLLRLVIFRVIRVWIITNTMELLKVMRHLLHRFDLIRTHQRVIADFVCEKYFDVGAKRA